MKSTAFWIFVAGLVMLMNPGCKDGCRTVAEHLVTYGLDRL